MKGDTTRSANANTRMMCTPQFKPVSSTRKAMFS